MVIIGGSGCGKSTLLRHLVGSLRPTSGSIKLFGEEITRHRESEAGTIAGAVRDALPDRRVLASLTIAENVALPLWQHRREDQRHGSGANRPHEAGELVGLSGFENHKPAEISGGMKSARVSRGLSRSIPNCSSAMNPQRPRSIMTRWSISSRVS